MRAHLPGPFPGASPGFSHAATKNRDLTHCLSFSTFSLFSSQSFFTTQVQAGGGSPTLDTRAHEATAAPTDPHHHPPGSATGSLIANLDFPAIPRRGIRGNQITELFTLFVQLMG